MITLPHSLKFSQLDFPMLTSPRHWKIVSIDSVVWFPVLLDFFIYRYIVVQQMTWFRTEAWCCANSILDTLQTRLNEKLQEEGSSGQGWKTRLHPWCRASSVRVVSCLAIFSAVQWWGCRMVTVQWWGCRMAIVQWRGCRMATVQWRECRTTRLVKDFKRKYKKFLTY